MGENKLLLPYNEKPLVYSTINAALSYTDEVVVVIGHERERMEEALKDLPIRIVYCEDYLKGQKYSSLRGIMEVHDDDFAIIPGDLPLISFDDFQGTESLLASHVIARAIYRGIPGHPVMFRKEHRDKLLAFSGTMKEDTVAFYIARCKFKDHDFLTASTLLDDFRHKFGRSAFLEDAEAMYAISLYNMCPGPTRDQSMTSQAVIAISEFMSHYPESEQYPLFKDMTDDLTWRMHEKAYLNAYTYYKIERYNSAIIAFRNALRQYPDSHRREDLLYHIVMSSYKLASNSIESKQLDRYMSTLDAYYSFIMEFPESKYLKDLEHVEEQTKRFIEKNRKEE